MSKQPVRTNVSDFIKTTMGSQLVIPVYQRNYTWNPEKETSRLLDDMELLLKKKIDRHFMGILIYIESDVSAMFKQLQIVDGQQRLTTAFIFLLCLKRVAKEKKQNEVVGMIDDYYLYNRHSSDEAKLRLKPTVSDDDVYAKLVYGSEKDLSRKDKESSVYRNYEAIYHRIIEFSKKYPLIEVLDCLSKLDILVFPLSQDDNAQQIFESINSTGAPLTSADLIRNYILMNDQNEAQERNYRLYWQPLELNFQDSRRLEEFFRYYLAAKTYNLLNRKDVYEGFKDYWNDSKVDRDTMLKDVNRYCRYYHAIYDGPAEEEAIEEALKDFRRSESRLPAPFLLEMYRMYEDKQMNQETFIKQIRLIDTYLTRRSLCGYDNGSLTRYFPQLLRSVKKHYQKKKRNIHEITKVYLINYNRGKQFAMPTDNQLRKELREINAYSLMCIRPVLERIEHFGATAEVDTSKLNIEHIMPQHPNAYWKKVIKTNDENEYAYYVNLIGNLTLCAEYDNTKMGNQDFHFKKNVLSKTLHIRMNTEILKKKEWGIEQILERCDSLAKQIIQIYPYQGGKELTESNDDDIILLTAPTVNAKAVYHNEKSIEVLAGSTMKAYGPKEMKMMRELYRNMMDLGVISETVEGRIQFEKNYRFHDLNTAAQFLLHRGGDNTNAWTREDGSSIQKKKEEKPKQQSQSKQKKTASPKKPTSRSRNRSTKEKVQKPKNIETRTITKETIKPKEETKQKKESLLKKLFGGKH